MKLRILVDLDCIVVDTIPSWLDRIHQRTGVRACLRDITSWDLAACYPLTTVSREDIFSVINEPGFTADLPPMPGALENLKKLHDAGHKIYLVTARFGTNNMPETITWVKKHLPWFDAEKRLCFLHDKSLINADILIDDRAETLTAYRAAHLHARLLAISYPYNKNVPYGTYCVAYNAEAWPQLYGAVERLSSE